MNKTFRIVFYVLIICTVIAKCGFAANGTPGISDEVLKTIEVKCDLIYPDLVAIRRQVHMHPELSGQEQQRYT